LSLVVLSIYSSIRTRERRNILYVEENKKMQYLYQVVELLLPWIMILPSGHEYFNTNLTFMWPSIMLNFL